MRVGMIAEVHPGIKPMLEQQDPLSPVGRIELTFINKSNGFPMVPFQPSEETICDVCTLCCGFKLSEHWKVIKGQSHASRRDR